MQANGIPLGVLTAPANRHDLPLLALILEVAEASTRTFERASVHLDRAYDSKPIRQLLEGHGLNGLISEEGKPSLLGTTKRWIVERTNCQSNAHKKLFYEKAILVKPTWRL